MKNTKKEDGKAKTADAIAATNNISYVVKMQVIKYNERRQETVLVSSEQKFESPRAIDARNEAFRYANELFQDSTVDGKLCPRHIDAISDNKHKQFKNITLVYVGIECVDNPTGERFMLELIGYEDENGLFSENLIAEYCLYRIYGYATDGYVTIIEDNDQMQYTILNTSIINVKEELELMYKNNIDELLKNNALILDKGRSVWYLPNYLMPIDYLELLGKVSNGTFTVAA